MNGDTEYIEDLIGRYIVGEATEQQARDLQAWCALSPDNQKYLDDAMMIFEKATLPGDGGFDTDKAWAKVLSEIRPSGTSRLFSPVWGVAAGIALVFALSLLFFKPWIQPEEFLFASENEVETHLMPDLTEVALNRQSEISVTFDQRRKTGTIQLQGEALISIPKDKKVQWTVRAGELMIEDIGTIFLVNAKPDSPVVEVSVQEGIVRFYTQDQDGMTLHAGEKGVYDKANGTFSKIEADANDTAFKTKDFSFQGENLHQIIATVAEVYGKTILLEGPIGDCKLTVEFENENLETILSIISETLGLKVSEEGNQIRISGDGCF